MRLFAILFVLLGAVSANAQFTIASPFYVAAFHRAVAAAGGGDACSSCTNETFNGAGTVIPGWKYGDNSAGVVTNVNYATAPAPLNGDQSLLIRNPDSQAGYLNLTVATASEHWVRMTINITNTVVNNMRIYTAEDNVGGRMIQVQLISGAMRIVCGTANATTVSTLSANTTYYVWIHYLKGSGANAVADVAFSSSKTRPTSGDGFAQVTNGSSTADVVDIYLNVSDIAFGSGIMGVIYDDVSFSRSQIGDVP